MRGSGSTDAANHRRYDSRDSPPAARARPGGTPHALSTVSSTAARRSTRDTGGLAPSLRGFQSSCGLAARPSVNPALVVSTKPQRPASLLICALSLANGSAASSGSSDSPPASAGSGISDPTGPPASSANARSNSRAAGPTHPRASTVQARARVPDATWRSGSAQPDRPAPIG